MNFKLHKQDGNFVSNIALWINMLGLGFGVNGRRIHWLAAISILSFIITTFLQVLFILLQAKNDTAMYDCISGISFCVMGLIKLYSLRATQERWCSLLTNVSDLQDKQLNCENPMTDDECEGEVNLFQRHIIRHTQKFITTSKLLSRIYTITGVVYVLSPFIEYAIWKVQGADVPEYPHILPVWTTLDNIYFPVYVTTVLAEGIAAVYCVCVHIVFDISVVGMMIFIHGQFLLLHEYSERIGGRGRSCKLSLEKDKRAHIRISRCQYIHASLIKFVNEISSLTQNILGIYFNVATLTLCSVAIQVLSDELSTTQLFKLLQYMCASLTQLFLYCNYGDVVINESSVGLGKGPSASAWWCLSPHIRREVALLCVSMSRQCRLLAGPFHTVNLPAFIQIVRTAYSYYAVLRQKSSN